MDNVFPKTKTLSFLDKSAKGIKALWSLFLFRRFLLLLLCLFLGLFTNTITIFILFFFCWGFLFCFSLFRDNWDKTIFIDYFLLFGSFLFILIICTLFLFKNDLSSTSLPRALIAFCTRFLPFWLINYLEFWFLARGLVYLRRIIIIIFIIIRAKFFHFACR